MEAAPHPWPALGVLLLRDGLVSKEELDEILTEQHDDRQMRISGRRLGEILIQRGRVTPSQVAKLVAEQYELPYVDFDVADIDLRVASVFSESDARRFSALPISRRTDGSYLLGIGDPGTVLFSEELRVLLGSVPRFAVVGPDAIERAIDYVYSQPVVLEPAVDREPSTDEAVVFDFPSAGTFIRAFEERELEVPTSDTAPLLGALLVRDGFLAAGELEAALAQQRLTPSRRLGEILVDRGIVAPAVIARLVAEQYEMRYFDLTALDVDPAVASRLPDEVARRLVAVPIAEHEDGSLDVAISDPTSAANSDELRQALGVPLTIVMASRDAIFSVLDGIQAPSFAPVTVETEGALEAGVEAIEPGAPAEAARDTGQATTTEDMVAAAGEVEPIADAEMEAAVDTGRALQPEASFEIVELHPAESASSSPTGADEDTLQAEATAALNAVDAEDGDTAETEAFSELHTIAGEAPAAESTADTAPAGDAPWSEATPLDPVAADTGHAADDHRQRAVGAEPASKGVEGDAFSWWQGEVAADAELRDTGDVLAGRYGSHTDDVTTGPTGTDEETLAGAPSRWRIVDESETGFEPETADAVPEEARADAPLEAKVEPRPAFELASSTDDSPSERVAPEHEDVAAARFQVVRARETEHEAFGEAPALGASDSERPEPPLDVQASEPEPHWLYQPLLDVDADEAEPGTVSTSELDVVDASDTEYVDTEYGDTEHTDDDTTATAPEEETEPPAEAGDEQSIALEPAVELPEFAPPIEEDEQSIALETAIEPPVVDEEPAPPVELVSSADEEPAWPSWLELVDEITPSDEANEADDYDETFFELPFMAVREIEDEPMQITEAPHVAVDESVHGVVEGRVILGNEPVAEETGEPVGPVAEATLGTADEPVADLVEELAAAVSDLAETSGDDGPVADEPAEPETPPEALLPAIDDALAAGATTLHFSPLGPDFAVRARVGGSVTELGTVSRSERDATLRRLEAEGVAHTYVTATSRGEKTTVFFRDRSSSPRALDDLSSDPSVAEAIRSALSRGAGAILVCGPPGHGTTTTLYAAVQELAAPDRIVTTVEHPIERLLEGVDQIEVDPARGGTYASVLHEVRFTDPDAVMVGDVFDRETAELALRDTSEGRLVLAGIHAPSAAGAIRRLTELGVEPRTVATSLDCIVAQRLVRTVCPSCRETYYASEDEFELLGLDDDEGPRLLARGTGCEECGGTGLLWRTAIFEILPLTDEIRELVADGSSPKKIQRAAVSGGMRTLRDEGVRLCLDGTTSVPELQRALGL